MKDGYVLASSAENALDIAMKSNCKEILVAGGGELNCAFLESDLIDGIALTIEPCILGQGIDFAGGSEFTKKLNLIDVEKLGGRIVKLNYEIVK